MSMDLRLFELTESQEESRSSLFFFKIAFFVLEVLSGLGTFYLLTKPGSCLYDTKEMRPKYRVLFIEPCHFQYLKKWLLAV